MNNFQVKSFSGSWRVAETQKSVNLVTHVIFWNYIHDVTLLIMQIYDDDDDVEVAFPFGIHGSLPHVEGIGR